MGEITDMVLDGTLCKTCGILVYDGDPHIAKIKEITPGFPRNCRSCEEEIKNREPCPKCGTGMRFKLNGGVECVICGYSEPCL
jgi:hypothetical protein